MGCHLFYWTTFILVCLTLTNAQLYQMKNVSKVALSVRDNAQMNDKENYLCADLLTASDFPKRKEKSRTYHLMKFVQSNYSKRDALDQSKLWKSQGESVACLVNEEEFVNIFYLLDPDLLMVKIRDTDPKAYLVDRLMRTGASIVRLSENDFDQLSETIPTGGNSTWTVDAFQETVHSNKSVLKLVPMFIVQLFGLVALVTGCALVVPRQEQLAKLIIVNHNLCGNQCHFYLVLGFLVVQAFVLTLLTFYYAKYMILVFVVLFAVIGTIAMIYVGFCLYCPSLERKFGPYSITLFERTLEVHVSLMQLIVILLAIIFNCVWLVFHLDPTVGYTLQCCIATFIVQFLLSSVLVFSSLKRIVIFFLMIVPFEMLDGIIFPSLNIANGNSIVETLSNQNLGFDGSSLPGGFKIVIRYYSGAASCAHLEYTGLLPFLHVVIPGFICALFMLHDCQQQIRYYRNFCTSVLGYILGQIFVQIFSTLTTRANPALLYLVPCTLVPPVIVANLFGGWSELRRLWNGEFIDEDHDLDKLREKRLSELSIVSVLKVNSFDSE